jgi:hypothetical protein
MAEPLAWFRCLAKNVFGFCAWKSLFGWHAGISPDHGHKTILSGHVGFIITLSGIGKIHSLRQRLAIIPRHPFRGMGGQFLCMAL